MKTHIITVNIGIDPMLLKLETLGIENRLTSPYVLP